MPSPNCDWGYDISDYCDVHPELGTLDDVDRLIEEATSRGIRVIFDLVPNHTSDQHEWFTDSSSSRSSRHRDWYVWAEPRNGSLPNNWVSVFDRKAAWEFDESTDQYYLHLFLPSQPDLNWWNEEVRDEFDKVMRFWFDRGIAGFRIDVAHAIVHDRQLRDNPPVTPEDHPQVTRTGQQQVYSVNRPEVHDVLRRWRSLCEEYDPPRFLVGETYLFDLAEVARYYGEKGDELNLAFNFPFMFSKLEATPLKSIVESTESLLPKDGWAGWAGSNHDAGRFPTRWCGGEQQRTRCALMMLLAQRGAPFLYYGDEIGMLERPIERDRMRDPVGRLRWPDDPGRDSSRTPMHWSSRPGAGFTDAGTETWLPLGDYEGCNVEDQRRDDSSILNLCRELIALRRETPDLRSGSYESLPLEGALWGWQRGDSTVVLLNLSESAEKVDVDGEIVAATTLGRKGEKVRGKVALDAWEGLILTSS